MQVLRADIGGGFSEVRLEVWPIFLLWFPLGLSYCGHHHSEVEEVLLLFKVLTSARMFIEFIIIYEAPYEAL